jgi:hypothetical protein
MSDVSPLLSMSRPYNLTFEEWSAEWWKWFLAIPKAISPAYDKGQKTENVHQNQTNPNVFFLSGTYDGSVKRTCNIPKRKAILVMLASCEANRLEYPDCKTENELRQRAKSGNNVSKLEVSIDDVKLENLLKDSQKHLFVNLHVQSPLFNVTLPKNNIFDISVGDTETVTEAVCDAYMLFLKPLSTDLKLYVSQVTEDDEASHTKGCKYDIEYDLKIK